MVLISKRELHKDASRLYINAKRIFVHKSSDDRPLRGRLILSATAPDALIEEWRASVESYYNLSMQAIVKAQKIERHPKISGWAEEPLLKEIEANLLFVGLLIVPRSSMIQGALTYMVKNNILEDPLDALSPALAEYIRDENDEKMKCALRFLTQRR